MGRSLYYLFYYYNSDFNYAFNIRGLNIEAKFGSNNWSPSQETPSRGGEGSPYQGTYPHVDGYEPVKAPYDTHPHQNALHRALTPLGGPLHHIPIKVAPLATLRRVAPDI